MVNVASLLTASARRHPDRCAVRFAGRRTSYGELREQAARFGSALLGRGLERGDRVAVLLPNCPQYLVVLFGAWHAGLVAVPVNAKLAGPEIQVILDDSGARAFVHAGAGTVAGLDLTGVQEVVVDVHGSGDTAGDAAGTAGTAGTGAAGFDRLLAEGSAELVPVDVAGDDLAWLFYTSGTTGRPKGAELSHRNLTVTTWTLLADVCDYRPSDLALHVAPLSHGSGLYSLGAIARGAENLIHDGGGFDPAEVLELVARERITIIAFLVPTMIVKLLGAPETDTSSLRCAVYGGAPIHVEHSRAMIERFGPVFVQIYGQGESPMTITYLDHGAAPDTPLDSAGVAHPGVEVQIMGADDRPLPAGEEGEICVRGDVVMRGYWNNPEATSRALRGGWLHTGDIGRLDEHGRLFLLDRSSDVIISGGSNIYPREVEEVLIQHPAVAEVVVFGVPDELWGENVVAAVVPAAAPPPANDLIDFSLTHIARFKKPKQIIYVDALPKSSYGKVLRREARRLALAAGETAGHEHVTGQPATIKSVDRDPGAAE
ncbi:AMP-dependent synthetase [Parafrankia soli]|uniref:AMP-dependent synthetase n=1 Tax=Parafrankia soli TaxID=2599596 RepID=A0A1S1PF49_9ACTN|nr:AMP-binding protein [Parafrankia soli]OHV19575.1 AMP-dependent synthetase [Parafrankia soli]